MNGPKGMVSLAPVLIEFNSRAREWNGILRLIHVVY
jgi:hypothetical protein